MALGSGTSHERYTADAKTQAGAVSELKVVYAELAAQQQTEYERVAAAQKQVTGELADGTREAEGFGGALGGIGKTLGKLKGQLAVLAAGAAAAAAAVKFVGDETARLDHIAKSAQKSGLGFEAYQRLNHVATLSGTSIESVGKASVKLERNLRDIAQKGGLEAATALADLGLSAKDLEGLTEADRLAVLAGEFSRLQDGAEKSALAVELFGKSGQDLIPLLNAGAEGVRGMVDATGTVFSREDLAKAEAYQDSLANLQKSVNDAKGAIAVGLAPAFQEIAEKLTAAGGEAARYLPAIVGYLEGIMAGIEPVVRYVGFFAEQMAMFGRVAEIGGRAIDGLVDSGRKLVQDSGVSEWAGKAKTELEALTSPGLEGLRAAIEENIPWAEDLGRSWDEVTRAITGASAASSEMSSIAKAQQRIVGLLGNAKVVGDDIEEARAKEVEHLTRGVTEAEHAVRLAEAQGVSASELERLYGEQHLARLRLLGTTEDVAALEKEMAGEEIRRARASRRPRGGTGPSDAQKMRAEGEAMLQVWGSQLRLAELTAELSGEAANEALYLGRVRKDLTVQALELDRQVLEVTRAKNSVERQQNETKIAVIDATIRELELEQQLTEQRYAQAEAQAWRDEWVASVHAEQQALGNVVELEEYRLEQRARQLESEGLLGEVYAVRLEQAQAQADAMLAELELREQLILAQDPETEADRIRQQMELDQIAHAQRMTIAKRDSQTRQLADAESKRLFAMERARKAASLKQALAIAQQVSDVTQAGGELAAFVAESTIKDEEKRQRVIMGIQGGIMMVEGAVNVGKAATNYASLNIPQGIAHTAAAAINFAKGGMLLAGKIPGGGGGGISSGGGAAAPREARERNTSEAARVPESVPAAADRGPRQLGGEGSQQMQGGVVINIQGDVAGDISDEFAEKMVLAQRNVGYRTGLG